MRQAAGERPVNSPVDGIRIMALLPQEWRKDLRNATGDVIIRVHTEEETTDVAIGAQVSRILAGSEVAHWELVACQVLAGGSGGVDEERS
jgi:hypothetical protein